MKLSIALVLCVVAVCVSADWKSTDKKSTDDTFETTSNFDGELDGSKVASKRFFGLGMLGLMGLYNPFFGLGLWGKRSTDEKFDEKFDAKKVEDVKRYLDKWAEEKLDNKRFEEKFEAEEKAMEEKRTTDPTIAHEWEIKKTAKRFWGYGLGLGMMGMYNPWFGMGLWGKRGVEKTAESKIDEEKIEMIKRWMELEEEKSEHTRKTRSTETTVETVDDEFEVADKKVADKRFWGLGMLGMMGMYNPFFGLGMWGKRSTDEKFPVEDKISKVDWEKREAEFKKFLEEEKVYADAPLSVKRGDSDITVEVPEKQLAELKKRWWGLGYGYGMGYGYGLGYGGWGMWGKRGDDKKAAPSPMIEEITKEKRAETFDRLFAGEL